MTVEVNLEPRIDPAAARRLQQILFDPHVQSEPKDEGNEEEETDTVDENQ